MIALEWACREGVECLVFSGEPLGAAGVRSSAEWAEMLPVYPSEVLARSPGRAALPSVLQPMAGRYSADGPTTVVFQPRYPFVAGTEYSVALRLGPHSDEAPILRLIKPGGGGEPVTTVLSIHPEIEEVPRNLLRLYVEFSSAMSEGYAAGCVRVLDADGAGLVDALLPMEPELWDPDRRRLTVLFDPGRIKQGLVPHQEVGYPLVDGGGVQVVVDCAFRDAAGRPLVAPRGRIYRVGPDLRGRIDPSGWTLSAPVAGGRDPLVVELDRAMDHALLQRCLWVIGPSGGPVAGWIATSGDGADRWRFTPKEPWAAGGYQLVVDPILEDVAGNSVQRAFDRDLDLPADDPACPLTTAVAFVVAAPGEQPSGPGDGL